MVRIFISAEIVLPCRFLSPMRDSSEFERLRRMPRILRNRNQLNFVSPKLEKPHEHYVQPAQKGSIPYPAPPTHSTAVPPIQ